MQYANCVSKAVDIIKCEGQVQLNAYCITAGMLRSELSRNGIKFEYIYVSKYEHIFKVKLSQQTRR